MKILLIPGNNSLSHVAKCAAIESVLTKRGHSVLVAAAHRHRDFLQRLSIANTILPDIQEADGGALPSVNWFRSPDFLERCFRAEIELLKSYRPDRVLGVFRFTTKVSAAQCGMAYDSITCGCMMPDTEEVLGFGPSETPADNQALFLGNFFRFAARKMGVAMGRFGMAPVRDIRDLLVGERTFLWDYPEFMPLPEIEGRFHVGPLTWEQWPDVCPTPAPFKKDDRPLAFVSLGTRPASRAVVIKAVRCLIACGYNVMVAAGGQDRLMDIFPEDPAVRCWRFAPLGTVLCHADLMVCHGGQMTIFEALRHRVPVLVIPSQPEQAHNGVCLERIGCGLRLTPPVAFKGEPRAYADAFAEQSDESVIDKIKEIASCREVARRLAQAQADLQRYDAPKMIADMIEEP